MNNWQVEVYIIWTWAIWRCLSSEVAMREPKRWDKHIQAPTSFCMYILEKTDCWTWEPISDAQYSYDSHRHTNQTENGRTPKNGCLAGGTTIMQQNKHL